ncbi:MAG: hypothetical protein LH654_06960, partial [Thermoleophilia bacterium]|nr:hypothetical protein [Thermoleophilia bacterium]
DPAPSDEKNPALAIELSVVGTALPLAIAGALVLGNRPQNGQLQGMSLAVAFVGPSLGHWYAGEFLSPGLVARVSVRCNTGVDPRVYDGLARHRRRRSSDAEIHA